MYNRQNSQAESLRKYRRRFYRERHDLFQIDIHRSWWSRIFLQPSRAVFISFMLVIIVGALLLTLPAASQNNQSIGIIDALFLSTSATCVTGLSVIDISQQLSLFGQLVLLFEMQIGALGIMTLSTFFVFMVSGKIGFTEREVLVDSFSQDPVGEMTQLLKMVMVVTLMIEFVGAIILTLRFLVDYPFQKAIYLGVFHSVSAFCNAGFSLFSDSFMSYRGDWVVNLTLIVLIILGGLGFFVIMDLLNQRRYLRYGYWRKLCLHTKLVLTMSLILYGAGFVFFLSLEYMNSLGSLPFDEKILASLFQAVTTRTAGFNTIDIGMMTNAMLFIFLILMFIGASPGSCGGGIKTTTFAILMASIVSRFRFRDEVNFFQRRVPEETVSRVITISSFSVVIVLLFTVVMMIFEVPRLSHHNASGQFMDYLFEVVSAFGTAGLSTGVTGSLSVIGKLSITLLMFVGRLGPLTIALAMHSRHSRPHFRYMQSNILVG